MGAILAQSLIRNNNFEPTKITVLKQSKKNQITGPNYLKSLADLPGNYKADLVFLCIKPQNASEILTDFAQQKIFHSKTTFISILAGKKIEFFEKIFGEKAKIIRSMPNLPIQHSQGIFAFLANQNITKLEIKNLQKIFVNFGAVFEVEKEKIFDGFTAIFGSGPAYIFFLQEIFTELAITIGINKDKACELVRKLFLGSALMSEKTDKDFLELRESVTSKGGTTAAALEVLQKNSSLKKLFQKAVESATAKSRELS